MKYIGLHIILTLLLLAWCSFWVGVHTDPRFEVRTVPPTSAYPAVAILTDKYYHQDYQIQDYPVTFGDDPTPKHLSLFFMASHFTRDCKPGTFIPVEAISQGVRMDQVLVPKVTEVPTP